MKHKITLSILLFGLFIINPVQAQNNSSFTKTFGSHLDERSFDLIEGNAGDILVAGYQESSSGDYEAIAYLLDSLGNLKTKKIFSDVNIFYELTQHDSNYIFFGVKSNQSKPYDTRLVVVKTDFNLNLVDSFNVFLMDTLAVGEINTIVDNRGNYVSSGFLFDPYQNFSPVSFVYQISKNGDMKRHKLGPYTGYNSNLSDQIIIEHFDKQGYYLFDQVNDDGSHIVYLDSNLNIVPSRSIEKYDMQYHTNKSYRATKISSHELLYIDAIYNKNYNIIVVDTANQFNYVKEFGESNYYDRPLNGLSKYDNNLFISGTYFPSLTIADFSNDTNGIRIIKMDTAFNVHWEREIDRNAWFLYSAVYATKDGGCLVAAPVYDADTMNFHHDIVLFKIDANGNITGTHRIEDAAGQSLSVYPNPGDDYFSFNLPIGKATLQVFNQNGKLLFDQPLTGKGSQKIDMKQYASGVYFLRLIDDKQRIVGTAKWIKR